MVSRIWYFYFIPFNATHPVPTNIHLYFKHVYAGRVPDCGKTSGSFTRLTRLSNVLCSNSGSGYCFTQLHKPWCAGFQSALCSEVPGSSASVPLGRNTSRSWTMLMDWKVLGDRCNVRYHPSICFEGLTKNHKTLQWGQIVCGLRSERSRSGNRTTVPTEWFFPLYRQVGMGVK